MKREQNDVLRRASKFEVLSIAAVLVTLLVVGLHAWTQETGPIPPTPLFMKVCPKKATAEECYNCCETTCKNDKGYMCQ